MSIDAVLDQRPNVRDFVEVVKRSGNFDPSRDVSNATQNKIIEHFTTGIVAFQIDRSKMPIARQIAVVFPHKWEILRSRYSRGVINWLQRYKPLHTSSRELANAKQAFPEEFASIRTAFSFVSEFEELITDRKVRDPNPRKRPKILNLSNTHNLDAYLSRLLDYKVLFPDMMGYARLGELWEKHELGKHVHNSSANALTILKILFPDKLAQNSQLSQLKADLIKTYRERLGADPQNLDQIFKLYVLEADEAFIDQNGMLIVRNRPLVPEVRVPLPEVRRFS